MINTDPAHVVFLCGIATYLAIRAAIQYRFSAEKKTVRNSTASDRLLIVLVATGQVVLPLVFLFTSWLNKADYTLPAFAIWVGTPLMVAALWLFWRAHADLGNCWSVTLELNHDHRLVTHGVYQFIRHPMYASFFGLALSQVFLINNALAGWAAMVSVTLLYVLRIPHEERMMLETFGDEYRCYMERAHSLIPRWRASPVER